MRGEVSPKRVRVYAGGQLVADSLAPVLVWEIPYYPTYYLPEEDVRATLKAAADDTYDVIIGDLTLPGAARRRPRGHRVDLPNAVAGEPEDRRVRLLLQREGRHLRGRRAAGAAGVAVQLSHDVGMHDIVYESESMLRQLQPPRRIVPFSIRKHGMPGMGGDLTDRPESALDIIIAQLRKDARWYDEDVPVGQWVRFEARLGLVK